MKHAGPDALDALGGLLQSEWERLPVSTADQQERLLALVDRGP